MSEPDSDRAGDEHEWERFLQQQDPKTETDLEPPEKHIADPKRRGSPSRHMGRHTRTPPDQGET